MLLGYFLGALLGLILHAPPRTALLPARMLRLGILLVGIDNPFLPQVVAGISAEAEASGYKIMMAVGAARMPLEASMIEQMIDNRMDGLILVAAQISGRMLATYASQSPICIIGHHEATGSNFDTVNSDDLHGASIAVRALLAQGYRDIGMVSLASTRVADPETIAAGGVGASGGSIFRKRNANRQI